MRVVLAARALHHDVVGQDEQIVAERLRGLRDVAETGGFEVGKLESEFHVHLAGG
jgi:hypothetical protein